jgi:hypothetical protein
MTRRLQLLAVSSAAVALLGWTAELARADVLITEPARVIDCGDDITVGVRYQSYSGGSRRLEISIKSISGSTLSRRTLRAMTTWRDYSYGPRCERRYTVVLRHPDWSVRYHVRVRD